MYLYLVLQDIELAAVPHCENLNGKFGYDFQQISTSSSVTISAIIFILPPANEARELTF